MNLIFSQLNHYIINSFCEFLNFKPMKKNFFILMIIFMLIWIELAVGIFGTAFAGS